MLASSSCSTGCFNILTSFLIRLLVSDVGEQHDDEDADGGDCFLLFLISFGSGSVGWLVAFFAVLVVLAFFAGGSSPQSSSKKVRFGRPRFFGYKVISFEIQILW